MSDELVHRLRVADADTKAIFGEDFVSTQGEAADEIERLTLDWVREQGERTSAELARDQALLEIERLRAEVADWRRQAMQRSEDWREQNARADKAESALAALRKRVDEAPTSSVISGVFGIAAVAATMPGDLVGKRVALVVLGEG